MLTDPPVNSPAATVPELIVETFKRDPVPVKKPSALVERFVVLTDPPVRSPAATVPELIVETFN